MSKENVYPDNFCERKWKTNFHLDKLDIRRCNGAPGGTLWLRKIAVLTCPQLRHNGVYLVNKEH